MLTCFSFFWRNPIMLWVCCEFIFQFLLLSWYCPWSDVRLNTFQTFTIFDKIFVLTVEMYWHWQRTIRDFHWSLHCTSCIIVKNLNVSILRLWIFILYNTHIKHVLCISHVETLCRRIWLQKWAKPWILSIHFSCTRSTLDKQTWPGRGDEIIILFI